MVPLVTAGFLTLGEPPVAAANSFSMILKSRTQTKCSEERVKFGMAYMVQSAFDAAQVDEVSGDDDVQFDELECERVPSFPSCST